MREDGMETGIKTTIGARTETTAMTTYEAGTIVGTMLAMDIVTVTADEQVRNMTIIEGHLRL
jgi:hypothetical protein